MRWALDPILRNTYYHFHAARRCAILAQAAKGMTMLSVRLVMVACLAVFSISLTPAPVSQTEADTGCTAVETPGNGCGCCL